MGGRNRIDPEYYNCYKTRLRATNDEFKCEIKIRVFFLYFVFSNTIDLEKVLKSNEIRSTAFKRFYLISPAFIQKLTHIKI